MNRFELSDLPERAHIHFIGIGGISMSGLAQIMLENKFYVTGSDRQKTHITKKLEDLGAVIYEGHNPENVAGADLVVHTAAVHDDNPELCAARAAGIRTIDRAECLGAVMKQYKKAVGVAGTHGKTSTTSMIAHALVYAGVEPTISLGGELDLIGGNIRVGKSDIFVTEACEYTNSFLKFFPTIALITNIEEDHLDFFGGIDDIIESFKVFAGLVGREGTVIVCGGDKNIDRAIEGLKCRILYYGLSEEFDYYPKNIIYNAGFPEFDIYFKGKFCCHLDLKVPGEHNIKNALAAVAVSCELGVSADEAARGIETYSGVHRRFEKKGMYNGAVVIDDYAHHPTEIKATLKAAQKFEPAKLWCVFQPHTYSRTKLLWNEFKEAFDNVDELILVDIYAAREKSDGQTSSEKLAAEIAGRGVSVKYLKDFNSASEYVKKRLKSGDVLFTMGAGDVYKIGEEILK